MAIETVDAREFLGKPFKGYEIGKLAAPPDVDLLRWLTTIKDASGMYLCNEDWYGIKADEIAPRHLYPKNGSKVVMDIVPNVEGVVIDGTPSIGLFHLAPTGAKSLLVTTVGITSFVTKEAQRLKIWRRLESSNSRNGVNDPEYREFLKSIDAKYEIVPWKELSDDRLNRFLYDKL
jgi:hypothetical protein